MQISDNQCHIQRAPKMFYNYKTDINRLHDVYDGKLYGRGVGKTTLIAHLLAGQIELGDCDICCRINTFRDLNYLKPIIERVLSEHRISWKWERHNVLNFGNETYCYFYIADRWDFYTAGHFEHAVIDFRDYIPNPLKNILHINLQLISRMLKSNTVIPNLFFIDDESKTEKLDDEKIKKLNDLYKQAVDLIEGVSEDGK